MPTPDPAPLAQTAVEPGLRVPPTVRSGARLRVPAGWTVQVRLPGAVLRGSDVLVTSETEAEAEITVEGPGDARRTGRTTVLPASAALLEAATARPAPDPDVRAPGLAFSLHLRLEQGGRHEWLNGGRGVAFLQAAMVGDDRRSTRTLRRPAVFQDDQGWVVLCVIADDQGRPCPPRPGAIAVLRSDDLLTWTELAPLDFEGVQVASEPRGDYDVLTRTYRISWTDGSGARRAARFAGSDHETTLADMEAPVLLLDLPEPDSGGVPVTQRIAGSLRRRLGPSVDVPADAGAPDAAVTASEHQPFPFIRDRADPFIARWGQGFLFIATDDSDDRNLESRGLQIRAASSIADLPNADDHRIVGPGVAGIEGAFWAPELHVIGGRLRCLFAPSIGSRDWRTVQCHITTLRIGGDPLVEHDWSTPVPILQRDGAALQRDPDHPGISLDMTYFEAAGRSYVVWSQRYITDVTGDAELWIATIDPSSPERLSSEPVRIAVPEFAWELNDASVVEGPSVIARSGMLHLTYSAAAVGPRYCVGELTAHADADLLDPRTWRKRARPLLSSDPAIGQWGPGHNSFVVDTDGRLLLVYHAKTTPRSPGRDTALREVAWSDEGELLLDRALLADQQDAASGAAP